MTAVSTEITMHILNSLFALILQVPNLFSGESGESPVAPPGHGNVSVVLLVVHNIFDLFWACETQKSLRKVTESILSHLLYEYAY